MHPKERLLGLRSLMNNADSDQKAYDLACDILVQCFCGSQVDDHLTKDLMKDVASVANHWRAELRKEASS